MERPGRCEVLVVGAGVTGLTAAVGLARCGISVRVVERSTEPGLGSRGRGLRAGSLRTFDDLGVADGLVGYGAANASLQLHVGRRPVGEPCPAPLVIAAWRVEEVLRQALSGLGVEVEWGRRLDALDQDDDAVTGTVAHPDGDPERVRADYVVGADGVESTARNLLGIGVGAGVGTGPVRRQAYVADVVVNGLVRGDVGYVWYAAEGITVLAPNPGTSTWWFTSPAPGEPPDPPTRASCEALFRARTGRTDVAFTDAPWLGRYPAEAAVAERFRLGRVFLAGDAAHRYPPAAWAGVDSGARDAYNLAWKLAAVLRGAADADALLDSYEDECRAVALDTERATRLPGRLARLAPVRGRLARRVLPPGPRRTHHRGSPLTRELGPRRAGLRAGDLVPDVRLWHVEEAADVRLRDLMRGPHWTVLGFGSSCAPAVEGAVRRFGTAVHGEVIGAVRGALGVTLLDNYSESRDRLAPRGGTVLAIRPDGYVGLRAGSRPEVVQAYLEGMLGAGVTL